MRHYLIFIFLLGLSLFSCSTDPMQIEEEEMEEMNETVETYSYLALGDSYTIGQGVTQENSWPFQLKDSLKSNYSIDLDPLQVIAQTGWTTTNLTNQIITIEPEKHDLVSLLIGVNNQYQGGSFETFKTEFDALLETAISLTAEEDRVFVVSIPDYGVTPFGSSNAPQIAAELNMYNTYMENICVEQNIPFINITEISRELGNGDMALANDNLHPSGFQYSLWVQEIMPTVVQLLN